MSRTLELLDILGAAIVLSIIVLVVLSLATYITGAIRGLRDEE